MNFLRKSLLVCLLGLYSIEVIKCAPALSDETLVATKPCESEDLLKCDSNDIVCETKNSERRVKRQTICAENPQCTFCDSLPVLEDENLIVEPEIVGTISPILDYDNIPNNEAIIIDADISSIIESQPMDQQKRETGKLIERNIVIENDNETQYYRGYVDPSSNITTIIRLTNMINNTNVINMPTTLNNTNINNIHVYSNKSSSSGGKFGLGYTENGPCCWSMKGGSCKTTTAGLKCNHKKVKVCGRQCSKKLIHPNRSPCNQIPQWPYIICQQPHPQFMQFPHYPQYNPSYPDFENENGDDDEDDFPMFPEDEELENPESGWVIMQEKCKIVSEDGLHITNCTENDVEFDHPYARNSIDDGPKRVARHTGKYPQNIHSPSHRPTPYMQPFGYPMIQPIFYQPIPMFIPQYFAPPAYVNNYPQQLPFPPTDNEQYYNEPVEPKSNKKSRKHAKKHPIIVEHDDEL